MTNKLEWQMWGYATVPSLEEAKEFAEIVYQSCELEELSIEKSLNKIFYRVNTRVSGEGFSEERPFDAVIMPSYEGGFKLIYDKSNVKKRVPKEKRYEEHLNFVLLHEMGHTFFYDKRETPPRRLPKYSSNEEERFCDEFANSLLKLLTGK